METEEINDVLNRTQKETVMKRIILIACFVTLVAGIAQAQPHRGGGNPAQRLTEKLGLDENQAAEVTSIIEETRALHEGENQNHHHQA